CSRLTNNYSDRKEPRAMPPGIGYPTQQRQITPATVNMADLSAMALRMREEEERARRRRLLGQSPDVEFVEADGGMDIQPGRVGTGGSGGAGSGGDDTTLAGRVLGLGMRGTAATGQVLSPAARYMENMWVKAPQAVAGGLAGGASGAADY